jgi:glycosyltransferase involved in cell wall biosynthesis
MRIWIINPFDELPGDTDVRHRYWALSETLADIGHSVTWWSSNFSHRTKRHRNLRVSASSRENLTFDLRLIKTSPYTRNVSFARLRNHRQFARRFLAEARQLIAAHPDQAPDRMVVSLPPLGTADAAFPLRDDLGGSANCQVILDIQDAWPETFNRLLPFDPKIASAMGKLLFFPLYSAARGACLGADRVSAVSQTYIEMARGYLDKPKSMHLCYLGIDADRFLEVHTKPQKPFRIVYLGSLEKSYDVTTLIRAAREASEEGISVELHFAGAGSQRKFVEGCAKRSQSIHYHGLLKGTELLALLRECHAGVIPISKESFIALPNKLFDYCAAGLPVISSLEGECRRLLDTNKAGLFYEPGSVDSLKSVIKDYLQNPDLLGLHGRNASALAEDRLDRSKTYPELAHFIEGK